MILNKDEFFEKLHKRVGDSAETEDITFLEDITDTYNDLERRANGDGVNWEEKYKQNDKAWRERYTHRFFSGSDVNNPNVRDSYEPDEPDAESITVDDLFEVKERR